MLPMFSHPEWIMLLFVSIVVMLSVCIIVYGSPVPVSAISDYSAYVRNPMDISIVKAKVERSE